MVVFCEVSLKVIFFSCPIFLVAIGLTFSFIFFLVFLLIVEKIEKVTKIVGLEVKGVYKGE